MGRIARVVAPGVPHHITQRGNARQVVFDDARDRRVYLALLRYYAERFRLRIWAWCLMSNHVHLLAVPETAESLRCTLGQTHHDYARYRNARRAMCGHLWQSRYYSCPVDEPGVWTVLAYIERNPVRAGLVQLAEDYVWSSARAHVVGRDREDFLDMSTWRAAYTAERWRDILQIGIEEESMQERLRLATLTGRPFGSGQFIKELELASNRELKLKPVGRKPKGKEVANQSLLTIGV
jgi:REP-associated tyrosine transposase